MRYTRYSTANDVMKEFLIYGAELTDMGFPILPAAFFFCCALHLSRLATGFRLHYSAGIRPAKLFLFDALQLLLSR